MSKTRFDVKKAGIVGGHPRQSIATKYIGPTNTRGSRIKVTSSGGISKTYSWDYELDIFENHAAAARMFANHMKWPGKLVAGGTKDGYVFVIVNK